MTTAAQATSGERTPVLITRALIREWGACYIDDGDESQIDELAAGRESMTPREICALDIPHADKMWIVTHALWLRDPWFCYDFALWCARESLQHVEPDWRERISAVIEGASGLRERPAAAAAWAAGAAWAAAWTAGAAWAAGAAAAEAAAAAAAAAAEAAWAAAAAAWAAWAAWAAEAAEAAGAAGAAGAAQIEHALQLIEAP